MARPTEEDRIEAIRGLFVGLAQADEGRGLKPDDSTHVFERFFRVDGRLTDGTGVGLPIARSIIEAHAGSISVRSDGIGKGSTFVVGLPHNNPRTA